MDRFFRGQIGLLILGGIFGLVLTWSEVSQAQACCAAGAAVSPGRLALHEKALLGVQLTPAWGLGSYDAESTFHGKAKGTKQMDLTLTPFITLKLVDRLQWGINVPFVMSVRKGETSEAEVGGGVGDATTNLRYDFIRDGEYRYVPGIAMLGAVSAPTGRTPESARNMLGSDATGLGVWQFGGGLWCERSFEKWLLTGALLVTLRSARTVADFKSQLSPQVTGILAVGYSFSHNWGLAVFGSYSTEGRAKIDGERIDGTVKRLLRLNLASSFTWRDVWRFQAGAFINPPVDQVAQNQLSSTGFSFTMMRSWM